MQCPSCGGNSISEIDIRLKSDENVLFFSCRFCETKWWKFDGEPIALDQVLTLTAEKEPAR